MQKEQPSYSGIVLNITLFGPFIPLSIWISDNCCLTRLAPSLINGFVDFI